MKIIPHKFYFNKSTNETASFYGAWPGPGYEVVSKGYTIMNQDGTIGIGRKPFEDRLQAERWLNSQRQPIAKTFIFDVDFEISVENTDSLDGYKSILCEVY